MVGRVGGTSVFSENTVTSCCLFSQPRNHQLLEQRPGDFNLMNVMFYAFSITLTIKQKKQQK